jgi:hypothetical protein
MSNAFITGGTGYMGRERAMIQVRPKGLAELSWH